MQLCAPPLTESALFASLVATAALVLSPSIGAEPALMADAQGVADGFDFPVGWPDADGYVDAQPFGVNHHLGSDWNGRRGGWSDYGDPVYAVARGVVTFAEDLGGGWGNVVRVAHRLETGLVVESMYAHLSGVEVSVGQMVRRGEPVGEIGAADGRYLPHLHFEMRTDTALPAGPGYSTHRRGWLDPTAFIESHRPRTIGSTAAPSESLAILAEEEVEGR